MPDDARLSKLLWDAREIAEMFRDILNRRTAYVQQVLDEIDRYRAERGWNPHGFGGEDNVQPTSEET